MQRWTWLVFLLVGVLGMGLTSCAHVEQPAESKEELALRIVESDEFHAWKTATDTNREAMFASDREKMRDYFRDNPGNICVSPPAALLEIDGSERYIETSCDLRAKRAALEAVYPGFWKVIKEDYTTLINHYIDHRDLHAENEAYLMKLYERSKTNQ